MVLAMLSSIFAFVVLAAVSGENATDANSPAGRKAIRIMSIFGGLVWMGTTYVIYKIPTSDPTSSDASSSNGPPHPTSQEDEPYVWF